MPQPGVYRKKQSIEGSPPLQQGPSTGFLQSLQRQLALPRPSEQQKRKVFTPETWSPHPAKVLKFCILCICLSPFVISLQEDMVAIFINTLF